MLIRVYLARAACMPRGLYVLLALFFLLKNKFLSIEISRPTKPIFTKFLPHGRYLIVDCRSEPLFDGSRDFAMDTNFKF